MNPVELNLFGSRLESVCEEMGLVLRNTAFSPNIRDRLDFSCAVFDADGGLCAQAAHIPVHLGSMAFAMADIVGKTEWSEGDQLIFNDPYLGGTHLPDITLVAPVFVDQHLVGFVVNRAHHANIGADTPGSMPVSSSLQEEGVVIEPSFLYRHGHKNRQFYQELLQRIGHQTDTAGDLSAQLSANMTGIRQLQQLVHEYGRDAYLQGLVSLNQYAETLAASVLKKIPDGCYDFVDYLDDDGQGTTGIPVKLALTVEKGKIRADFEGTATQVAGNVNCPLSVAAAAVFYVFRCLMPDQTPACAGTFRAIAIAAPRGCVLNANFPAAVAAGNVETSSRVVDVVMGALAQAIPEQIPAASHGSMNNIAMGAVGERGWDYYETLGGGMGAGADSAGLSAVQTHMTNTLNTPVEVLESRFPLQVVSYSIRYGSGGEGRHRGGDGLVRQYRFLEPAQVSLLTERRRYQPWGLHGGSAGQSGENRLNGEALPAKIQLTLTPGDVLTIATPGGGGYG